MLISSFHLSNNCYVCTSVYNSLHNMIMYITPLQPQLATCALVKSIDKFCVTLQPEYADKNRTEQKCRRCVKSILPSMHLNIL